MDEISFLLAIMAVMFTLMSVVNFFDIRERLQVEHHITKSTSFLFGFEIGTAVLLWIKFIIRLIERLC